MSFRVSALVAVAALTLGSVTPAFAQPQAPVRPRFSPFGNVFTPGPAALTPPGQDVFGFVGPGRAGAFVGPAFVNPSFLGLPGGVGPLAYQSAFPGAYAPAAALQPSGVVGSFNNLGHWYGGNTGVYGHWYPNGVASGRGVLGLSGGGVYGAGGPVGGAGTGGPVRSGSMIGNVGGTALGVGATMNQFRR